MGYAERILRVTDYVRTNLANDLSLESLARVACFSPHHFHRIFRAETGETVTHFVQRCRLERAAYLMKASPERTLNSIAHDAGFASQSDFSRVFRRQYGLPPTQWDRRSRLQPAVHPDYAGEVAAARAAGPQPVAIVREHRACRVAYVRIARPFEGPSLPQGYARLIEAMEARGVNWRASRLLGMSWDNYETTPLEQVQFDLGFVVGEGIAASGELGIHDFPELRAAEVHADGPLVRVAVAWDYLYDEWLPGSSYEPADLPGIKRFRTRPDETGWERWNVDCSIAIRSLAG